MILVVIFLIFMIWHVFFRNVWVDESYRFVLLLVFYIAGATSKADLGKGTPDCFGGLLTEFFLPNCAQGSQQENRKYGLPRLPPTSFVRRPASGFRQSAIDVRHSLPAIGDGHPTLEDPGSGRLEDPGSGIENRGCRIGGSRRAIVGIPLCLLTYLPYSHTYLTYLPYLPYLPYLLY